MKSSSFVRCPNRCQTVEQDMKLVRYYGAHHTPLYRCAQCGREFSARYTSVFTGLLLESLSIPLHRFKTRQGAWRPWHRPAGAG